MMDKILVTKKQDELFNNMAFIEVNKHPSSRIATEVNALLRLIYLTIVLRS